MRRRNNPWNKGKFRPDRKSIKSKDSGLGMRDKARMPDSDYEQKSSLMWEKQGEARWIAKELLGHTQKSL